MKMFIKYIIVAVIVVPTSITNSWGWWDKSTHKILTESAASQFFDQGFLESEIPLGKVTNKATIWLQDGSELEDQSNFIGIPTRSLNHFHDPTKPLAQAGLNDLFSGMSAILWAQNPTAQSGKTGGDWSWQTVRDHQYNYLTSLSKADEDAYLAKLLKGLGYQLHLLQDMSQPNHVRNDTHIFDGMGWKASNGFETWAKERPKDKIEEMLLSTKSAEIIESVSVDLTAPYEGGLIPVARLSDTRGPLSTPSNSYSQGLAEYTNANYFSEDTFFAAERFAVDDAHYFPYPRKDETDLQRFINKDLPTIPLSDIDSKVYQGFSIGKIQGATTGQILKCLAKPNWNTSDIYQRYGEGEEFYNSFIQDEECYKEQASLLLPRAVGYSAAMLDYFYRGDLTMSIPTDTPPTSSRIRLKVRNSTSTGEAMDGGSIDLMVIFKQLRKNSSADSGILVPDSDFQFRKYTLPGCSEPSQRCQSIGTTDTVLDFDLSEKPLPPLITNISLVVVYHGKLGFEADAVAFNEVMLEGISGDLELGLPSSGVFATTSGSSIANQFSNLALSARNTSTTVAAGPGSAELLVAYRIAPEDPFQNKSLTIPGTVYYSSATVSHEGISASSMTDLNYSLAGVQIPVTATDVYVSLIHTGNDGKVIYGYRDISEPTPVDVFNNADYVCLNEQWYPAGDPATTAMADQLGNHNSFDEDIDTNIHDFGDIYMKFTSTTDPSMVSTTNYDFFDPGPLSPGTMKRMGYILTDYTFKYGSMRKWIHSDSKDIWSGDIGVAAFLNDGRGVKNPADEGGNYLLYNMRGKLMWGGAGFVFDNMRLPADSKCDWATLPVVP